VTFVVVYLREAHAMDSDLPMAFGEIEDPITLEERREMAVFSSEAMGLTMPSVVDDMDDAVAIAYQGWPERLYLVDTDGDVAFRCGPGPFGFDPDGLEAAIRDLLR
jgi:hypothetical protein